MFRSRWLCSVGFYVAINWTIVEATRCLAFGTLLDLIGGPVQSRLNQRMIEQVRAFAAHDTREASHIGEHRSIAIVSVEPE